MKTLLTLIVLIALAGGGYYWYSQNMAAPATSVETSDPFGTSNASEVEMDHTIPEGAVMEDGTLPGPADEPAASEGARGGPTAEATAGAVKEFSVTNQGFNFSPKNITVKKGDRVKITYTNGGGTHDFRIEGYNVGTKVLSGGASETIEFVADEVGTFESYCSVGNHRAMGMVGTFIVTE